MTKYVVVTGGVLSGLGKGITTSSIGALLRARGISVTAVKIDPYLNSDAGTMNPFEHGEVFVLQDGGEADLDLGNYERYLDIPLTRDNNITTGKAYRTVIEKERRGDYLGKTVQIVPHVTNVIKEWIQRVAKESRASSARTTAARPTKSLSFCTSKGLTTISSAVCTSRRRTARRSSRNGPTS